MTSSKKRNPLETTPVRLLYICNSFQVKFVLSRPKIPSKWNSVSGKVTENPFQVKSCSSHGRLTTPSGWKSAQPLQPQCHCWVTPWLSPNVAFEWQTVQERELAVESFPHWTAHTVSDHVTRHTPAMSLHHFWLCLRELGLFFKTFF